MTPIAHPPTRTIVSYNISVLLACAFLAQCFIYPWSRAKVDRPESSPSALIAVAKIVASQVFYCLSYSLAKDPCVRPTQPPPHAILTLTWIRGRRISPRESIYLRVLDVYLPRPTHPLRPCARERATQHPAPDSACTALCARRAWTSSELCRIPDLTDEGWCSMSIRT